MTLVASWIAVDTHGPSAIYLASDSRLTWGTNLVYEHCRKVFVCLNSPDIFAYCGDVLFPSIVLNQIVLLADHGILFEPTASCEDRSIAVRKMLSALIKKYPSWATVMKDSCEIIHASREISGEFFVRSYKWTKSTADWIVKPITLTTESDKIHVIGSGKDQFEEHYRKQWKASNAKTSRALFHAFIDTLTYNKDPYCGGPPQLVGLYRGKYNSRFFGIPYGGRRYLHGVGVDGLANLNCIEWRNELFEVCDGVTMLLKDKAQRQPNAVAR